MQLSKVHLKVLQKVQHSLLSFLEDMELYQITEQTE